MITPFPIASIFLNILTNKILTKYQLNHIFEYEIDNHYQHFDRHTYYLRRFIDESPLYR